MTKGSGVRFVRQGGCRHGSSDLEPFFFPVPLKSSPGVHQSLHSYLRHGTRCNTVMTLTTMADAVIADDIKEGSPGFHQRLPTCAIRGNAITRVRKEGDVKGDDMITGCSESHQGLHFYNRNPPKSRHDGQNNGREQ